MRHTDSIEKLIAGRLARHLPLDETHLAGLLETPPSPEIGDYGLPCYALSKYLHKAPNDIAEDLRGKVELPEGVREAKADGPYLNFFLDRPAVTASVLKLIHGLGSAYGSDDVGAGKTIVIDFGSPNVAKDLGVHHLPSAVIGRALYRVYEKLGYRCAGINFPGDWGTSFGSLIAAVERYDVPDPDALTVSDLQELYVRYTRDAAAQPELLQTARDAFARLEQGESRATALWQAFRQIGLEEFDQVYGMLGVTFDHVNAESSYREQIDGMVRRLLDQGVAIESAGALIVPLDDENLPPCMVRKSDGTSLYMSRDIPAAEHRWEQFRFEKCLYVTGSEQSLHFKQLKAVLKRMGYEWADRIEHVNFGLIRMRDPETGKTRVGSTRRGEMVLLKDLLQEAVSRARAKIEESSGRFGQDADLDDLAAQVGIGAVVFSELSTRRTRDVIFDWDSMLDFEGDTGPYVQYAHARLSSILRKAEQEVVDDVDFALLTLPEEWVLARHLAGFPAAVRRAAAESEPSVIATYLLELCADFSSYYSAGMRDPDRRVLCPADDLRAARLLLVDAARHVIRGGLELLGVAAPERM